MKADGFYIIKNVTHENKKGNLIWLDKNQLNEIPGKKSVIILLKTTAPLDLFNPGVNTILNVLTDGNIEVKGQPIKTTINGDIIL
jgi:hypothetical protein